MYITNTTEDVRKLVEELETTSDLTKLKFLVYIFGLLNNNQINDKNESNPDLIEDDDMTMLNSEAIGLTTNACTILLQYFAMLYNSMTDSKDAYEDNGNILGINYNKEDKKLASKFEKLNFNEKLDIFSEIIIRYDNETYFDNRILVVSLNSELSGFDIAHTIQKYKK
ncbi:MAG TPA: hypothetical protein IAB56_02455 [Candidatus Scybalousia intestinigallinarum]|nr:hypothetical protein [Candidatus Scybalousia intestinigallinarum]